MSYYRVENINKFFGKNNVLKDICFTIEKGEVLSIIGQSGCGKTTLLRCLNYLESIDGGQVYLNDELLLDNKYPNSEKDIISKRRHYGLVFQSFNLFPQYNVFENIKLPLQLMEEKRKKENLPSIVNGNIDEKVLYLLSKVGLERKKDFYPSQLSGGQAQRVAIVRAMALQPDILCFDEPTSALDPELTNEVLNLIQELKEKYHLTMIIVTHEMAFAKKISDKVLFMKEGSIVEFGTPQKVFNSNNVETQTFLKSYIEVNN